MADDDEIPTNPIEQWNRRVTAAPAHPWQAEVARLREALSAIETATNYSPHRDAGSWDANLAKMIHAYARLLPGSLAEAATTGKDAA